MYCDQDDVWFPDKIERTLTKMKALEDKWGKDIPLLVHTDMEVVDGNLKVIDASHRRRQGINPVRSGKLNAALVQSGMWGCTMMFNRKLIDLATPIPLEGMVHDAWLALIASACGKIDFLKEPTMFYRQHSSNWAGSLGSDFPWFIKYVLKNPDFQKHSELRFMRCMVRGYYFYKRYGTFLNDSQRDMLEAFIDLKYEPVWKELYLRWKYGFWNHGFWPNVGLIIATMRMGKGDPKYRQRI